MAIPALTPIVQAVGDYTAPAYDLQSVSASDTVDIGTGPCRGLLVGSGGAATVTMASGGKATLVPLQTGYNWISVSRVWATGLVASNIWAIY